MVPFSAKQKHLKEEPGWGNSR